MLSVLIDHSLRSEIGPKAGRVPGFGILYKPGVV